MQYIKIKYLNHYKFAILFTNQGPSSVVPIRPRRTVVRIPTRKTCIPTVLQVSPEHYISLLIKISILVYHIFCVKSNKKGGFAPPLFTHYVRSIHLRGNYPESPGQPPAQNQDDQEGLESENRQERPANPPYYRPAQNIGILTAEASYLR